MNSTLYGLPVVESIHCQDVPRFTLSEKVPVTPEFRASFNTWAREFFGVGDVAYKMNNPAIGGEILVVSPRVAAQLRATSRHLTGPF